MAEFWKGKRVLVTGASGFLGSHLVPMLQGVGAEVFTVPHFDPLTNFGYDLTSGPDVAQMYTDAQRNMGMPDFVFHLAATVGGIGANRQSPADFYFQNTLMNTYVAEYARRYEVGKLVAVGSVCAYPKYTATPFKEENLWEGYPEETNAAYGVSKRGLLVHLQAMRQQYGYNGIYLIPTNLYGPGDHSDPLTSHVIPALIRKIDEAQRAGLDTVEVWGTGSASRDFLYVADCAEALVMAAYRYNRPEPVNLGSGEEVCIAGLVEVLKRIMGFTGRIVYDPRYPDGQPRRVLNTSRAWDGFGWKASTKLEDGLRKTVEWWRASQK